MVPASIRVYAERMARGNDVREFRERHGLTQRRLADLLGVDPMTVSAWERGTRNPPALMLELALAELSRRLNKKSRRQ
jgi:transcriptional regulator with XRE-family HTH domain